MTERSGTDITDRDARVDRVLFSAWGKTNDRDRDAEAWAFHPALCHMVDVGYVAESWLKASDFLRMRFAELLGLEEGDVVSLLSAITALHDLGKLSSGFQEKSTNGWNAGYGSIDGIERPSKSAGFDHGLATAVMVDEVTTARNDKWGLDPWRDAFFVAGGHHGRLFGLSEVAGNGFRHEYKDYHLIGKALRCAIDLVCDLFGTPNPWPRVKLETPTLILIAGFVSVCDWIGSNSVDYPFVGDSVNDEASLRTYLDRLRNSGAAPTKLAEFGLLNSVSTEEQTFTTLFGFDSPRPLQARTESLGFGSTPGPELLVVEAQMGSGKTEIALHAAAQALRNRTATGLYFALPTQASSNALYTRIADFTNRVRATEGSISLALAHGNRRFDKDFEGLVNRTYHTIREYRASGSSAVDDRQNMPSEVVAPGWLQSSKRTLLAGIGVGTIDQALLGQIQARHAFVRLFALAGKVVVFDEIHAYDTYTGKLIERLLEWLRALGSKVILLSATLPRKGREKLVGAFGVQLAAGDRLPEDDPYPLVLHWREGDPATLDVVRRGVTVSPEEKASVVVRTHEKTNEDRTAHGVELALDLAEKGGCIAWMRNTVREAQEAFDKLRAAARERSDTDDLEIRLLHSRYTRGDRASIEQKLIRVLGKEGIESDDRPRPRRMILVATQVIEQSVDLDFDAMISDLAPIDLLLQRIGRMHRHEEKVGDRFGHTSPVLHVLMPTPEERHDLAFGGSGYVYASELLAASAVLVQEHPEWEMPRDCRRLVSLLYDYDESWTPERLGVDPDALQEARSKLDASDDDRRGKALRVSMQGPSTRPRNLRMTAELHDDEGVRLQLATRLGLRGATMVLLTEQNGRLRFLGSECDVLPLPESDRRKEILEYERAVTTASVSFPWYSELNPDPEADHRVATLSQWWHERRPYDSTLFVLLDDEGKFEHPEIKGRYRSGGDEEEGGLYVERVGGGSDHRVSGEEL